MGCVNSIFFFDSLLKAALEGDKDAQNRLGDAYAFGEGTVANLKKAVEWYEKSAAQGQAEAIGNLGFCKLFGDGVTMNPIEGARLIRRAIELGDISGRNLYILATCYENGIGVVQDKTKALELYKQSADKGYFKASVAIRRLERKGDL